MIRSSSPPADLSTFLGADPKMGYTAVFSTPIERTRSSRGGAFRSSMLGMNPVSQGETPWP